MNLGLWEVPVTKKQLELLVMWLPIIEFLLALLIGLLLL
jgi:hypothetical protein